MLRVRGRCRDEGRARVESVRGGRRSCEEVARSVSGDHLGVGRAGIGSGHYETLHGGRRQVIVVVGGRLVVGRVVVVGHGVDVLVRPQTGGRFQGSASQAQGWSWDRPVVVVVEADGADRGAKQISRLHRPGEVGVRATLWRNVTTFVLLEKHSYTKLTSNFKAHKSEDNKIFEYIMHF